jgi:hypothetical protein
MSFFFEIPTDFVLYIFIQWIKKKEIGIFDSSCCNKSLRLTFLKILQLPGFYFKFNYSSSETTRIKYDPHPYDQIYNIWLNLRFIKLKELVICMNEIDCSSFIPDIVERITVTNTSKLHEIKMVNCFNMYHKLKRFCSCDDNVDIYFFQRVNRQILCNLVELSIYGKSMRSFTCVKLISIVCPNLTQLALYFHDDVTIEADTHNDWSDLFSNIKLQKLDLKLGNDKIKMCDYIYGCVRRFQLQTIHRCEISYWETDTNGMIQNSDILLNNFIMIVTSSILKSIYISVTVSRYETDDVNITFSYTITERIIVLKSLDYFADQEFLKERFFRCNIHSITLYNNDFTRHDCELFIFQCHPNSKLILDCCGFNIVDLEYLLANCKLTDLNITMTNDEDEDFEESNLIHQLLFAMFWNGKNSLAHLSLSGNGFTTITTSDVQNFLYICRNLKKLCMRKFDTVQIDWETIKLLTTVVIQLN